MALRWTGPANQSRYFRWDRRRRPSVWYQHDPLATVGQMHHEIKRMSRLGTGGNGNSLYIKSKDVEK